MPSPMHQLEQIWYQKPLLALMIGGVRHICGGKVVHRQKKKILNYVSLEISQISETK